MAHQYLKTLFTESVRAEQEQAGSRRGYERMEQAERGNEFSEFEKEFIERRDSFYMATISESGWPYVQHRGGEPGFIEVLSPTTLRYPDYRGNNQFISRGNIKSDDRVSLIFVDYPNRARLKLLGHLRFEEDGYFYLDLVGFDWNCPKHITPRWTATEIEMLKP